MIIEKHEEFPADEKVAEARPEPEAVPEREQPPPYAEGSRHPSVSAAGTVPGCSRENSVFQPSIQQHVNYVSLYSKHNAISGTYIIDPELPGHLETISQKLKKVAMMRNNITPNASFETRHGAISLNLATAGGTDIPNKTYVQVASRHGRVNVNLVSP
ncbi:hypothetical protein EIP86_006156 [Pleurotus ostreatoroseus]|nr:hypothetical protein EIP86_006156 [Pleurotus ostreatoroseus]